MSLGLGLGLTDLSVRGLTVTESLLLDDEPSESGFSLRKLSETYSGSVVRIRRSSDDAEQDIGFNGLDFDTVSAESFCGAGNGFVTTWYDQSGNGKDATQTTAGNQPQIVSSGSVITLNGKPSIQFEATLNQYLTVNGYIINLTTGNGGSSFGVYEYTNPTSGTLSDGAQYVYAIPDSYPPDTYSSNIIFGGNIGNSLLWVNGTEFSTQSAGQNLVSFNYDGTNFQVYKNGLASGSSGSATVNANAGNISGIGSRADAGSNGQFTGKLQEIINYNTDKSSARTVIETDINNYYLIY